MEGVRCGFEFGICVHRGAEGVLLDEVWAEADIGMRGTVTEPGKAGQEGQEVCPRAPLVTGQWGGHSPGP